MLSYASSSYIYLDVLLGSVFVYFALRFFASVSIRKPRHALPPGPTPLPLIGNLLNLPKSHDWVEWTKHKELYGPLSSVSILGKHKIILNCPRAASDLLDKRSSIYSDRACPEFFGNFVGWRHALAFLSNGPTFREHRKRLHQTIGTRAAVERFYPLVELEARRLLWRLAFRPQIGLVQQIRVTAGAIILNMSHGYAIDQLSKEPDPLVQLADDTVHNISTAGAGFWLVDLLPFLRYLPEWAPGMNFTEKAKPFRRLLDDLADRPHNFVKHQMAQGVAAPSFTSSQLEQCTNDADEHTIKWTALSLYSAGADTVVSALRSFFLAMTLYPDVQRRAQEEVDRVIGYGERLPSVEDREQMPYVWAVVKEVLRWRTATPLGIAHVAAEDDIYEGYFIPKGSMVSANIWGFTHDAKIYVDPMEFKPERHLAEDGHSPEQDPRAYAFGFGRRICPGKELAEVSLFVEMAMILATFDISKAIDTKGAVIEPCTEVTSGTISHPVEFECKITPRSEGALELIRSLEDEAPFVKSDREVLQRI